MYDLCYKAREEYKGIRIVKDVLEFLEDFNKDEAVMLYRDYQYNGDILFSFYSKERTGEEDKNDIFYFVGSADITIRIRIKPVPFKTKIKEFSIEYKRYNVVAEYSRFFKGWYISPKGSNYKKYVKLGTDNRSLYELLTFMKMDPFEYML